MRDHLTVTPGDTDHHSWPIEDVLLAFGWDGDTKRPQSNGWVPLRTCPFHGGGGGAAYDEATNAFKCWGCDAAGNSVTLVMQQESLDQEAAVEWLRNHVGETVSVQKREPVSRVLPWNRDK